MKRPSARAIGRFGQVLSLRVPHPPAHCKERDEQGTASLQAACIIAVLDLATCRRGAARAVAPIVPVTASSRRRRQSARPSSCEEAVPAPAQGSGPGGWPRSRSSSKQTEGATGPLPLGTGEEHDSHSLQSISPNPLPCFQVESRAPGACASTFALPEWATVRVTPLPSRFWPQIIETKELTLVCACQMIENEGVLYRDRRGGPPRRSLCRFGIHLPAIARALRAVVPLLHFPASIPRVPASYTETVRVAS